MRTRHEKILYIINRDESITNSTELLIALSSKE